MRDVTVAEREHRPKGVASVRGSAIGMFVVAAVVAAVLTPMSAHSFDLHAPVRDDGPQMVMFDGPPAHVDRAIDRMLEGLDVSDVQRGQVKQIALAVAADMRAQRGEGRALHERALQIFTAPTVDASAAEALRLQISAQLEQGSQRMMRAMIDVANVLTPDQRAKLGERMKERHTDMHDRSRRLQHDHGARPAALPAVQK